MEAQELSTEKAAHTPEPWTNKLVDHNRKYKKWTIEPSVGEVFFVNTEGAANAARIVLCVNACRGLTAEMVEEIPHLISEGRNLIEGTARICADAEAKLAAFDAMREALLGMLMPDGPSFPGIVEQAHAALKQADEASK